jgi:hypothetical protein
MSGIHDLTLFIIRIKSKKKKTNNKIKIKKFI